ncbi:MAG: ScyD/ScyE family protein [Caldilineaceae bacterium]|nr:ScyD/ScyE family protein [Caldilineaceae bacterium]
MRSRHSSLSLFLMLALVLALVMPNVAMAQADGPGEVVADGLNGPMGVLVDPDGNVWVIDSGLGGDQPMEVVNPETESMSEATMGNTARIVKVSAEDGAMTDVATVPSVASEAGASGGSRLALLDGQLYATVGEWLSTPDIDPPAGLATIVRVNDDGSTSEVAQFWPTERDVNPYPPVTHAHPYGIIGGPDGNLWVADAGGNTLYKVDPAGGALTAVATFDPLPGVFPRPDYDNQLLTDPVPTAVTVGGDGGIYVSLLSGAPFVPGSAKVLKVEEDGSFSDYATGLTMLTDLRTGPDGNLYATQFGVFTETGPTPASGAVIRVKEGGDSEVVASGLSFATSLDFNADGDAFVAVNGVGAPGSGQVIKLAGLTAAEGTPVSEVMGGMQPPAGGEATPEPTEEAMEEATPEATEEAMEEATPEATEEMAEEATPEATEEMMEEATPEATEEAMAEATPEPTEEMMEEATPETLPETGAANTSMPTGLAVVVVGLLLGTLAFVSRRRRA